MAHNPKNNGVQFAWLMEPEFQEIWAEWLKYRSERRLAAYKPTGLKRVFAALQRDSGNDMNVAIKMIEQSLEKTWQGIFPIKKQFNGTAKQQQPITADKLKSALVDRIASGI